MSKCSSGCRTQDHASYGECMRSKGAGAFGVSISKGFSADREKQWNRDLDAYSAARRQGIQPASTKRRDVDAAVAVSNATGQAWQA